MSTYPLVQKINFHRSLQVKCITVLISIVVFALFSFSIYINHCMICSIIGFFSVLLFGLSFAYTPLYCELDNEKLVIKKGIGSISLDFSDIQSMRHLKSDDIGNSLQILGNGGLFGFVGLFRNKKLGTYQAYITEKKELLLITMESGKKYVISVRQMYEVSDLFRGFKTSPQGILR